MKIEQIIPPATKTTELKPEQVTMLEVFKGTESAMAFAVRNLWTEISKEIQNIDATQPNAADLLAKSVEIRERTVEQIKTTLIEKDIEITPEQLNQIPLFHGINGNQAHEETLLSDTNPDLYTKVMTVLVPLISPHLKELRDYYDNVSTFNASDAPKQAA